jgi:uncharacterized protein
MIYMRFAKGRGEGVSALNQPREVSRKRFEFGEGDEIAYLEFDEDGDGWITLWHTEVPPALRGQGVASTLARTAFEYAREQNLKVDIVCPTVKEFVRRHPEFQTLVSK